MKNIVDASAVLAVCKKETGEKEATLHIRQGLISAVNLHEVLYVCDRLGKLELAQSIIKTAGLRVIAFDEHQSFLATRIDRLTNHLPEGRSLSLADRACLSLGLDHQLPIVTGDRKWSTLGLNVQLILFRENAN